MAAICFILLLKAVGILGTGLISRKCFDGVYVSIPSVIDEADGSESLNLLDVERCGPVSTHEVTELFAM
jgi:hypothetical protein